MYTKLKLKNKIIRFWKLLGPGLVTGASDDDPPELQLIRRPELLMDSRHFGLRLLHFRLWLRFNKCVPELV